MNDYEREKRRIDTAYYGLMAMLTAYFFFALIAICVR